MNSSTLIITMNVNNTKLSNAILKIVKLAKRGIGSYVCVSNVHMCMETFDSCEFRSVVNNADFVIPDGRPIYWAQRLLGASGAQQVRGQDIMNALCKVSSERSLKVGLYGGSSDEVLDEVKVKLKEAYPGINIVFSYSPPYRLLSIEEDDAVVSAIIDSSVDVLFVGIGCPKQEYWMAEHKDRLNCVMLGVGAAYDFIAGSKKHAPKWMQKSGLEWLFRLVSEPKRLWRRYLKQNPRFIYFFLQQWLFDKKFD